MSSVSIDNKNPSSFSTMLHNKDRPFPCTECQKCFRSNNNLREHLRIHTGERPYKCRVCEQAFTTSGTRGRHENTHGAALKLLKMGKKRYECTRCAEQFSGAAARIKHMKKNHKLTGQYFCIQCDIELASVEDLLEHHNVVHSAERGRISEVSALTGDHQDHAYHRYPLNDSNARNRHDFASQGPKRNLVCKRSKSYSRIQRKSLLKLRKICLKARKRNAGSSNEFVCRYCGERFAKLPLFLKHLWKHSKARSKMTAESDELVKCEIDEEEEEADIIVEGEIADNGPRVTMIDDVEVIEEGDIIVEDDFVGVGPDAVIVLEVVKGDDVTTESEIIDNKCQSVMISCESLPTIEHPGEVKGTSDETNDLQLLVEELVHRKYHYELQEAEQVQVKTETFSPPGRNHLPVQPASQNFCFNKSSHGLVTCDPSLEVLSGGTVVMCGETAKEAADNEDSVRDQGVSHNNNTAKTLFFTVHPGSTESNPQSINSSSFQTSMHITDVSRSQIFCELCGKRVKNFDQNGASDKAVYMCTECDQLFSSLQQLQDSSDMDALESLSHDVQDGMKRKPKRKSDLCRKTYSCSLCNVKFNAKKICDLHEISCTGEEKPLSERNTPSSGNSLLGRSKLMVPYSCTVCSRPFAFKYRLERHMLTHTGEKPFKCKECGKAYTSKEYLKSHTARHFNEYTHLCSTCGKSFADRLAWRLHKRVHEIAKRTKSLAFREYMCWLCGFQFRHASNLTKHLQRHRFKDEYPYKCGECDQQFRTKEGVRFHVGTHALDKPYLCMECPKTFPDAWCLRIHSRSHTKLGSFQCIVCSKKYRTTSSLRAHSRLHMDQRYKCEVCGETFGFSRQYRSHLIKHRPPFQCNVCGVTTTRAAGLRKHKKRFQHFQ